MFEKTDGIVLRTTEYHDSDKLLTVLTRDLGKITLKAAGVKNGRSKMKAACQLFAYSEFTLADYQGKFRITEAVSKELFTPLQQDIELYYLACYFAQVTDAVCQEGDESREMLSLLLNSLYALCTLKKPQRIVQAVFDLRCACICGFSPDLRGCMICGNEDADCFNITHGSLQCSRCAYEGQNGIRVPLPAGVREAMRFVCSCDAKKLFSFFIPEQYISVFSGTAESYLSVRLERGFSTLDAYKSLFI